MEVSLVPIEYIESIWPSIENYAKGAAMYTYGRFTSDDIKRGVLTNPQQLWVAFDENEMYGMVVTEVFTYPQIKALTMHFTGGRDLPKWKAPMLELLQKFGKDNGCTIIESYGRPGWEKVFKNDGFKQRFVFYELPVEN